MRAAQGVACMPDVLPCCPYACHVMSHSIHFYHFCLWELGGGGGGGGEVEEEEKEEGEECAEGEEEGL